MQFGGRTTEVMAGNVAGRARSAVWVGEIQVGHRQCSERIGGVMEIG